MHCCWGLNLYSHYGRWYAAAAAAKFLQSCPTLCNPRNGSPPGSPVPGILQARTLDGLPFPSPMHEVKSESEVTQSCPTLRDPIDSSPPGSPVPGILQARTLECRLQCMKVKSESEVAQLYLTLSDPMNCSLPGSSVRGIFQARVLEWGAIAFSKQITKPL